jgi:hypothetical protein
MMWRGRDFWTIFVMAVAMCDVGMAQDIAARNAPGVISGADLLAGQSILAASSNSDRADSGTGLSMGSSSSNAPMGFSSKAITSNMPASAATSEDRPIGPFSTVAVGLQTTSLGAGVEVATPLARTLNLRGGATFFNLGYDFGVDGTNYSFDLQLRSGQMTVDWFPFHGGFRVSSGFLIFKSQLSGAANVPAGNTFQLGSATFTSSATDPVHGNASLNFSRSLMPLVTFGFGNMIPRSGRHLSFPFEVGAAYMGHNAVQLNLQGTACIQYGCMSVSNPTIQQDIAGEQSNLNESIRRLQAYPIISMGAAYRF